MSQAAAAASAVPSENGGQAPVRELGSFPISSHWTMERLLKLSHPQIIALWRDLPAATLEELQGHFTGITPNAGDAERQARIAGNMYNEDSERGYWLGKAYRKTGANEGEGYNRWRRKGGQIVRNARFTTEVGVSLLDGKPSLLMYYGSYRPENPTFVDEVRKLDDYVYLGVGSTVGADGKRTPESFVLVGPTDEWIGGAAGTLVPDFVKPTK
ncbi:MAG: hypothetical protein WCO67_23930 [Betaproteobacteria bacterium]